MFEFPGAYYEVIRRDFRNLERETAFLSQLCPPDGSVLDVGCGTGTNLRMLAAADRTCVGIDQSAAFLKYAAARPAIGVTYHHSRASDFDTDDRFDLIFSIFVTLNYMPFREVRPVLAKVASWLKPGGHFVLDMAHLLNFVESYRPYVIAHHADGDVLITRMVRHDVQPLRAVWRHDETIIVSDNGSVAMFRNAFGL